MKFKTRKIPLTEEEERDRAEFFAEFTGEPLDIETFVKKMYLMNLSTLNV